MSKRADTPCTICGRLTWSGRGSLAAERRVCRPCRNPEGATRVWYANCAVCRRPFVGRAYNATLCSDECRFVQHHGRPRLRDTSGCTRCSGPLPADLRRRTCDACLNEARRVHDSMANRRRRARRRGVVSEPYTMGYIASRDRFRCGICRRKVSIALRYPHPQSASIDHIVPLVGGGADTRANVQLAHFICNSLKSDRGSWQQLALIG